MVKLEDDDDGDDDDVLSLPLIKIMIIVKHTIFTMFLSCWFESITYANAFNSHVIYIRGDAIIIICIFVDEKIEARS